MRRLFTPIVLILLLLARAAFAIEISPVNAARIGHKVWQNECAGTVEGLVSWNAGEAFPSLGIGHFIWYPTGNPGPFEESFPKLVHLFGQRGVKLPGWLNGAAPWRTRSEMQRDTKRVGELRSLLAQTIAIQTEFLIQRLESALPKMLEAAAVPNREAIRRRFQAVGATSDGVFALIDYVNFKGEGVLATERYQGEGWGLLQVLENMNGDADAVLDFANSAKRVLARRVHNSPPARHEQRWLAGWQARVARYADR